MTIRRRLACLLALTVPALFLVALTTPAQASVGTGWYQLHNVYYNECLTEDGDTGAIYLQACGTGTNINHSQLWDYTVFGQLVNVHSGLCLIVTGYDAGVWLTGGTACTTAPITVAEWNPDTTNEVITNAHTGWYLDADTAASGEIIQEPYIIDGIHWTMVAGT